MAWWVLPALAAGGAYVYIKGKKAKKAKVRDIGVPSKAEAIAAAERLGGPVFWTREGGWQISQRPMEFEKNMITQSSVAPIGIRTPRPQASMDGYPF